MSVVAVTTACTSSAAHHPVAVARPSTSSPTPTAASGATVWLCRPGGSPDPCTSDRTATVIDATGARHREPSRSDGQPVDCFYVYPTVSTESTANSDLVVHTEETEVAIAQASRFSQVCRVWAPMYRQRTLSDLFNLVDGSVNSAPNRTAYASLLAAWRDYLAHDNGGRRVVFIGHSQGAAMLVRLLRAQVDPNPALRRRVVLAILLGANVTTQTGKLAGGSFAHLPLCTRAGEPGCVIAYSSFGSQPPSLALFGRPGAGVSALSGETHKRGLSVACVNPDGFGTGTTSLHPYVPAEVVRATSVTTPWVALAGRYTATCRHGAGATWLQVVPTTDAAEAKALLSQSLGPAWGYHIVDVTIALGDLVADVRAAATS
jgi:pimeloyl-ACP methyl ester carboxylesterase